MDQKQPIRARGGSPAGTLTASGPATDFNDTDAQPSPTTFTLHGRLQGLVAPDFPEALEGAHVRLYRPRASPDVIAARAAALPKDTFSILTDEEVATKADDLLGEATLDETGRFEVTLGADTHYSGAAFEVDVYCGTVPRLPPRPRGHKP
jgi:hypothetical protein